MMKINIANALKRLEFFKDCDEALLEDISGHFHARKYFKRNTVSDTLDDDEHLYFVLNGSVSVSHYSNDAVVRILYIYCQGEVINCDSLFDEVGDFGEGFTAVARRDDTVVLAINKNKFRSLIDEYHVLNVQLRKHFCRMQKKHAERLKNLYLADCEQRLVGHILMLQVTDGRNYFLRCGNITHEELASFSNMTRETVTRISNDLSKKGVLVRNPAGKNILGVRT